MSLVVDQGVLYVRYRGKFVATESTVEEFDAMEREIHHLRIAHLRRMGDLAVERADFQKPTAHRFKLYRFAKRCDAEITRLTQPR